MIGRRFHLLFIPTLLSFLLPPTLAQLVIPTGQNYATRGSATSRKISSPNGKFILVLDQLSPPSTGFLVDVDLAASIRPADAQTPGPKWTLSFKGERLRLFGEDRVHVSDQGDYFLLCKDFGSTLALYKENTNQLFYIYGAPSSATALSGPPASLFRTNAVRPFRGPAPEPILRFDQLDGRKTVRLLGS